MFLVLILTDSPQFVNSCTVFQARQLLRLEDAVSISLYSDSLPVFSDFLYVIMIARYLTFSRGFSYSLMITKSSFSYDPKIRLNDNIYLTICIVLYFCHHVNTFFLFTEILSFLRIRTIWYRSAKVPSNI